MKRRDLPRALLPRIDTRALDEAVRRFPALLSLCRTTNPLCVIAWPFDVMEAIVREYRLVLAERSKGRVA